MKHSCQITHPQIVSGPCPWCEESLGDSSVAPTSTVWNVPAMLTALSSPNEDVRSMTVTNLYRDGLTTDVVVPLFSKALSDCSDHVRIMAELGLSDRG